MPSKRPALVWSRVERTSSRAAARVEMVSSGCASSDFMKSSVFAIAGIGPLLPSLYSTSTPRFSSIFTNVSALCKCCSVTPSLLSRRYLRSCSSCWSCSSACASPMSTGSVNIRTVASMTAYSSCGKSLASREKMSQVRLTSWHAPTPRSCRRGPSMSAQRLPLNASYGTDLSGIPKW